MNKKIYFNDKFLELKDNETQDSQNQLIKKITLSSLAEKEINKIISDFLNDEFSYSIIVSNDQIEFVFLNIKSRFYYIEAAGGFIENDKKYLLIHRLGRWDLPKGKLEKKETVEDAAIRECEEECGIKNLSLLKPLPSTYHIYAYKDGYALKKTAWFYMTTSFSEKLVPQLEENIDEVRWFSKEQIITSVLQDTYYTISDVIKTALVL